MAEKQTLADQHAELTAAYHERQAAFDALGNTNLNDEKRDAAHKRYVEANDAWEKLNSAFHSKKGA